MKRIVLSNIEKIHLAQQFLEKNLDQNVNLQKIAEASFLSPYHFHRMFHSVVGMTPRVYFEKLKLERSAFLLTITDHSIADIAWELSFDNPESYARSFKKMFQMTPTQFRKQNTRIQSDRIGNFEKPFSQNVSTKNISKKIKPLAISNKNAMYYRYVGPWEKSHKLWRKLMDSCLQIGIFNENTELFGIWYDDPLLVGKEKQRYDLGILLPDNKFDKNFMEQKFGFQFTKLQGNYMSYGYSGDFKNLENSYLALYNWLAKNPKLRIANKPTIEIYKKYPPFFSPQDCAMEICVPIHSES
ncbi:MAG: AraC family transcriptional regulator [Leptospira sp.]|nr:AraC family transcriptional regulator [Leptospira sp.]